MSVDQRLRRLEEELVLEEVQRLAEELGSDPDDVLRDYREISWRMARGGKDAAVRWMAEDLGVSEEEVRALWPDPAPGDELADAPSR